MKVKLNWTKHNCGGVVAIIPAELGGSSRTDGYRQSTVHIIPRAFGGRKCRMRISNHALEAWNFHHQFYENISHAKRALMEKLENQNQETETVRCPDHRNGGATRCPRGGAALQIWQRKQWGE